MAVVKRASTRLIMSEHPEYVCHKEKWRIVREAVASQYCDHVIPPEFGSSQRVIKRNANYIARAMYANYTASTSSTWTGLATQKDAKIELPPALEYLATDCTNDHLTMEQLRRKGIREIGLVGRFIMFADFPLVELGQTGEQIAIKNPLPRIHCYAAEDMISWDIDNSNGQEKLNFAVLRERVRKRANRYQWCEAYQYRVLEFDDQGHFTWSLRDEDDNVLLEGTPQANGKYWDYIPLGVVGSEDNNISVDEAPMYPIAHINFAHLRNSAAYEDNLDAHGQGTLILTSTMSWSEWKQMTAQKPFFLGSREGHYIGQPGSDAKLLQLEAAQELAEAMKRKEEQIVSLGGQIILPAQLNAPVQTTQLNMGAKTSPLINFVKNLEQGIRDRIDDCAKYLGVDATDVVIDFPKDFIPKNADSNVMRELVAQNLNGIISKSVVRDYDRQVDLIADGLTDDDIEAEIVEENSQLGGFIAPMNSAQQDNQTDPNQTQG